MVGVAGFEPATPSSRTRCIATAPLKIQRYSSRSALSVAFCSRGSTQLGYRFKAAAFFAMPHLIAEFRGCELIKYEGFAPTVENLAVLAKHRLGWDRDRDGTSTIKSRIWGPSRPVIHAAAILLVDGIRRGISIPENPASWLPYLKDPELLLPVLRASELARLRLPRIKQFRIRETDTIEFLP